MQREQNLTATSNFNTVSWLIIRHLVAVATRARGAYFNFCFSKDTRLLLLAVHFIQQQGKDGGGKQVARNIS